MVFESHKISNFLNKKLLIQIYFVLFILLNIIDFLNIIPNDLDFFKKLLSWSLIGYVFYKVSITKILIGTRKKLFDLGFIFAFCFMTIIHSLVLYLRVNVINSSSYPIFNYILNLVPATSNFIITCFVIGLFLTLILSISLILNNEINQNSFLGSFNFKETYFKQIYLQILSFLFLLFFSIIVFNFFMEWFALAVDSIILVFGLIYYLFIYISRHMSNKVSSILSDISNSGNSFYYNLIEKFSNKNTFFVGVSVLLAIHLLVDIGVYLIPYLLGTHNALYFESLSAAGRSHQTLFGLFNFTKSLLYNDLTQISGGFLINFGIVLIYLIDYFMIFSLMVLPFYIFYKNLNKQKFHFNKLFAIILLSSLFFNLSLYFLPSLNMPLQIDSPNVLSVKGVDFHTESIISEINSYQLVTSILIFFVILGFLLFRFDKYRFYFEKLILIFVIIFFVYYIYLFFTSSIQEDFSQVESSFVNNLDYQNFGKFEFIQSIYLNDSMYKPSRIKISYFDKKLNLDATIIPFSNLKSFENDYVEYSENHDDYLFIQVNNIDVNKKVYFDDISNIYLPENIYDFSTNKFLISNFSIIYFVGNNHFKLEEMEGKQEVNLNLEESDINKILINVNERNYILDKIQIFLASLRLVLSSLFYIFGSLGFILYFVRKNIFSSSNL